MIKILLQWFICFYGITRQYVWVIASILQFSLAPNEICLKMKMSKCSFHLVLNALPCSDYVTDFLRSCYLINIWHLHAPSETDSRPTLSESLELVTRLPSRFQFESKLNRNSKFIDAYSNRVICLNAYLISFARFPNDNMMI